LDLATLAGRLKEMPEILEEHFEGAKSGLMLAPSKIQALMLSATDVHIFGCFIGLGEN
jgi:hypothetical protein